jgi:tRNA uridine 5-carboxymethylaminomethyl modification enzyme
VSSEHTWDVIVVGAGHAGAEAAAAASRMGVKTLLLTMDLKAIARMSCNPAIGGLAKGQIVREVDALGGLMGRVADRTAIQFRLLNRSKGPAVRAPRAQCDRRLYHVEMRRALEEIDGLVIREETVTGISTEAGRVAGVVCESGAHYKAKAVVLAPGTFLDAVLHIGQEIAEGGRRDEPPAKGVSDSLRALGFSVQRLKTGTPPRLDGATIDYDRLEVQHGDQTPVFFSFATETAALPQVPCHIAFTNERTHEIIRSNLDRAPVYTGQIKSTGPRYCPSIEIKVVRFQDKARHQLFIEPEGLDTDEIYLNGAATSLPREVQEEMVHSVEGLERARITRYGYAVEYDFVPPTEIYATLETKRVGGLFFAGQINGTSGYEEAAGQGILGGVNAALLVKGGGGVTIGRDEAYIGVMVDDLVTKGVDEPYRMFTSRAEFRLLLRYDNADVRLTPLGRRLGLVNDEAWARFEEKRRQISQVRRFLEETRRDGAPLERFLARPQVRIDELTNDYPELGRFSKEALEAAETDVKYAGYIERQRVQVERMRRQEGQRIPRDIDYDAVAQLRFESREKLKLHRPETIGQASRIPGVNPADISILMMYLNSRAAVGT